MTTTDLESLPIGKIEWHKTLNIRTSTEDKEVNLYRSGFFGGEVFWKTETRRVDIIQQEHIGIHKGEIVGREWRKVYHY